MSRDTKEQIEKIKKAIQDLQFDCYMAKIPITIYCQYKQGSKCVEEKVVVSPASVDYKGNTNMFYDIQNVMSGNFETVPKRKRDKEADPFEMDGQEGSNIIYE